MQRTAKSNLIDRDYIHRQLSRNKLARELELDFLLFAKENGDNVEEYDLPIAFLQNRELSCVQYNTSDHPNVYKEHSLFFFTHAKYYEGMQLLRHNEKKLGKIDSYPANLNMEHRLKMEEARLINSLDRLSSDIRMEPNKLWDEPSLVFVYHHMVGKAHMSDLSAYKFAGVFLVNPKRICYI